MRGLVILACFALSGCEAQFKLGRGGLDRPADKPAAYESSLWATSPSAIQTVIEGLTEAQQVRTLARQLAR